MERGTPPHGGEREAGEEARKIRWGVYVRNVARSGNVTVYREMHVYAETQVHTTSWMRSGDGSDGGGTKRGGKRMYESPLVEAVPLCICDKFTSPRGGVDRVYLVARNFISKTFDPDAQILV